MAHSIFLNAAFPIKRSIAAPPLVPTVEELLVIATDRKRSDFIGDLDHSATALGIALFCGDSAVSICEMWADDNAAPPVPLCIQVALRERLINAAWEHIYSVQDAQTEDSER